MSVIARHVHVAMALVATLGLSGVSRADDGDDGIEDPESPPVERPVRPRSAFDGLGLYLKLQGGYSPRELYGVPVNSAALDAGVGGRLGILSVYFEANFMFGWTQSGLAVRNYELGPTVELALWRFGLGGGMYGGLLNVDRATQPCQTCGPSSSLLAVELGLRAHLTFDVFQWGAPVAWGKSGGLYVGVEGAVEGLGGATYGGPTFMLGVRAF
jgi:hypothetical protein